ncbi:MAG: type III restriction endonuclease subunit R, partial [Thaumarchaeota archaeon]|nr:type III restriction endonuclease subunit R [Nitrososphaerota archaeon]
ARIMHSFENQRFELLEELSKPEHLLHIDSNTIKKAEEQEQSGSGEEETLRCIVDTVGKIGKLGEQIRNIIAVQMLSEGWDARNVTHIMGLRAFSSQLLCEQVVGRGLRRTSYEIDSKTGRYSPEYVNVFGVPFTFLPHEGKGGGEPPKSTTTIEPDSDKIQHEISWPNIDRIDMEYSPKLEIDWSKTKPLLINSDQISITASMAEIIDGKPVVKTMSDIDLRSWHDNLRFQRMIFLASKDIYLEMLPGWKGTKDFLLAQIISLVERFIQTGKIIVEDVKNDIMRTKMSMLFNMQKIVKHVFEHITDSNTEKSSIQLNDFKPIKSTTDMRIWHTKKPVIHNKKSHINQTPYDLTWELAAIQEFERNANVISWVKNDHIGFVIKYLYNGILHDYWPDFIIRLENNVILVLEIKGVDDDMNRKKRDYLKRWVNAVNTDGNYGTWVWDVAFSPNTVKSIISKHAKSRESSIEYAKCPKCAKIAISRKNIEKKFGYCNINGITRPQSWCRNCRM